MNKYFAVNVVASMRNQGTKFKILKRVTAVSSIPHPIKVTSKNELMKDHMRITKEILKVFFIWPWANKFLIY
jgi:hypothetical protein